ncbi:DUF6483 family protein [Desulfosporosinus sp. PR]|uniref:DUF6483 family protein n=1 Tax=Candidatus Desulfosporosinus nitrosoreducens TaxID=3401928 RepID=UPI0027E6F820|nr:DUF6483 family protein [Desulfosporosinus sp. PR]MDQ7092936.1 DUF6483 family protein [Desulfosporosinus sp. PR]
MFEDKDYLMKMIKEFTISLGKIMGLKAENKIEESQEALNDTLKYVTELNIEVIEALPYDILIHKVSGNRLFNTGKHLMLGELLIQQADIFEIKGEKSRAKNLYWKSLNILINIFLCGDALASEEDKSRIDELIEKIGWFNLPNESKLSLFQYYELTNKYAKAEDVLFDLIKTTEVNQDILTKGIDFYERLINKDPDDLEKGNLPMDEVSEGLATLREYQKKQ